MKRATSALVVRYAFSSLLLAGCQQTVESNRIVLQGYSDSNYARLDAAVGARVCVAGRLFTTSVGAYYALQPPEDDGVIDTAFSKIVIDLPGVGASQSYSSRGRVRTTCGVLEDATPFENCRDRFCRWYRLAQTGRVKSS